MRLRIGTYNILHGADFPRKLKTGEDVVDLALCAESISRMSLDICGLNEVRNQEKVEGLCHQARALAERLGYHYAFARAIDHAGGEYGNALLSRFPILSVALHPLIVPQDERMMGARYENRVILEARLDVSGKELGVLVTHFGLHEDEIMLAAKTVTSLAEGYPLPLVVMGDFNATPDHAAIALLKSYFADTAAASDAPLYTFPSHEPREKIDYIMTCGEFSLLSIDTPPIFTSDHLPLVAEFEL